jgi:hypothetical protein
MASEARRNFIDWFVVVVVVARVLLFVAAAVAKREIMVDSPCTPRWTMMWVRRLGGE